MFPSPGCAPRSQCRTPENTNPGNASTITAAIAKLLPGTSPMGRLRSVMSAADPTVASMLERVNFPWHRIGAGLNSLDRDARAFGAAELPNEHLFGCLARHYCATHGGAEPGQGCLLRCILRRYRRRFSQSPAVSCTYGRAVLRSTPARSATTCSPGPVVSRGPRSSRSTLNSMPRNVLGWRYRPRCSPTSQRCSNSQVLQPPVEPALAPCDVRDESDDPVLVVPAAICVNASIDQWDSPASQRPWSNAQML